MSSESQAILLNAIPLLVGAALYLLSAGVLRRAFRRARETGREAELPLASIFVCVGAAMAIVGVLVLLHREPLAGNAWVSLAAVLLAVLPAVLFLVRRGDRNAGRRGHIGEEETGAQPRRERMATLAEELARAQDGESIAELLLAAATEGLEVEFASLALIEGTTATGLAARLDGRSLPWPGELQVDLERQPSGIATAVFEVAPLAVYDLASSPAGDRELAEAIGARSGAWAPLVAGETVLAVLAVATRGQRAFPAEDLALLQELASGAAPALERTRSSTALTAALERERLVAEISQRLRGQADPGDAIRLAVEEAGRALGATRAYLRLDEDGAIAMGADWTEAGAQALGERAAQLPEAALAVRQRRTAELDDVPAAALNAATRELLERLEARSALATPILARDDVIGVLGFHRGERGRWSPLDTRLAEAVGRELGLALQTARLLEANERRLRQQSALVTAAQTVTSELELETVLERLVNVVVGLLGADAADCWILEGDPPILRCRAVNGLPAEEVGRELEPSGAFAEALEARRPVLRRELPRPGQAEPRAIPRRFEEVMVAPIWSLGEARGVLSVWVRVAGRFRAADLELLGTFGTLASLALRNAEVFEERVRQARSQRGFYRIASVLGRPVSFVGTLDAVAEAAGEVLDGDFACVLMRRADNLYLASSQALPEPLALALREGFDGGGTLAAVAADRRMLVATDVTEDDRFDPAWRRLAVESGYTSLLAIPVAGPRGAEGPGLAIVYFREERRFTDDDLELARHLAGAAHGALERSAVYEEERAARSLAQQLARTGSLLANELDPAAVLQEVVRDAPQLVGVEACAIRTTDGEELVVAAATGEGLEGLVGTRSPATSWLSGDVVQSGARVALSDAATDERLVAADPILGRGYRAYLGVPLAAPEGALHGVLAVYARRPRVWRNEEIEALLALAANASAVLSNAELYQRVLLERERSVAILSSIADGIVAVDRQGAVVLWNQAAEQITGVAAREAVGRTPLQLLGRDLESGEGAPEGNRLLSVPRSGGELWLSLTEAVMHDPSGAVAGRVYAFRDISADRSVEQMKSDFVSAVSQELRRPLTSVYGFAETLLRNDVLFGEVERRVFLGYIASESARLTKIVDRLLSVARLDAGDLQVAVAPTDVRPLVSEAVASVESNGHRLVVDLPVEPVTASTDAEKLRQVLANLLDNAVKFSPEGGTVTVTAREAGDDAVELRVTDEGIGIPSGELARIFGKFYRHERGGRSVEGTGLGLFIAQGLVEAMGGRISVASVEGEGASFTLRLPRA